MRAFLLMSSATLAVGLASAALAQEDRVVEIPDAYMVGRGPENLGIPRPTAAALQEKKARAASIEKAAALNGTLYAVVAPAYDGSNGTQSYLRLFNGGAIATNFSVAVVGSPSGRTMGTANFSVPRNASLQYSMQAIIGAASAGSLTNGDTGYALYIQNLEPTAGYQHVTFNNGNRFFENNSVCSNLLNRAVATVSASQVLINVHTSRLPDYPSQIEIHNYWNAGVNYRVSVIDALTGTVKGNVTVQTAANASYVLPMTFFEQQVGWTPAANEQHANLIVTDQSGAPPYEVLGHSIINNTLTARINMTTACAVNAPITSSGGTIDYGDGGLNGY